MSRGSSSCGSRKVPVHVPPCQMLKTDIPVSAYQLRCMLRELPRTSKKTSPSRGRGAASDADMPLMVACSHPFVQFVTNIARQASRTPRDAPERKRKSRGLISPPRVQGDIEDGIIIRGHAAARVVV